MAPQGRSVLRARREFWIESRLGGEIVRHGHKARTWLVCSSNFRSQLDDLSPSFDDQQYPTITRPQVVRSGIFCNTQRGKAYGGHVSSRWEAPALGGTVQPASRSSSTP